MKNGIHPNNLHPLRISKSQIIQKLTDEEKYILDAEQDSFKRKDFGLMATLSGRSKILESISYKVRSKQILVRFLKPMEQFIGIDMNKYGPFHKEDVAKLPFENARSIIGSGEAIEIIIVELNDPLLLKRQDKNNCSVTL